MPVPYDPVIRHEHPAFAYVCGPCAFGQPNKPCGAKGCNCICNVSAAVVQEAIELTEGEHGPALDHLTPATVEWEEPPTKPEPIGTWASGTHGIEIPVGSPFPPERTEQKSHNKPVDPHAVALIGLSINCAAIALLAEMRTAATVVIIVSAACTAILALASLREKE